MPTVNNLPKIGGKEPVLTFVGGGWTTSTSGNRYGIGYDMYVDNEYWSFSNPTATCKKDFTALIILMQGNNTDYGTRTRRTLYTQSGDILDTGTAQYTQVNREYEFKVGDTLTSWQKNESSQGTVGFAMIFDIDPR